MIKFIFFKQLNQTMYNLIFVHSGINFKQFCSYYLIFNWPKPRKKFLIMNNYINVTYPVHKKLQVYPKPTSFSAELGMSTEKNKRKKKELVLGKSLSFFMIIKNKTRVCLIWAQLLCFRWKIELVFCWQSLF